MEVLYTAGELHDKIKGLFEDPHPRDRRVALVAYVGGQAEGFLPDPKGLEIVCCLKPGASDALTIDRLRNRGATAYKSDRLHMKVYWSSSRGCVICSANASGNALGGGNQKEAGVWLPRGLVDIDRLWNYARPKLIRDPDLKRLTRLSERVFSSSAGEGEKRDLDFLKLLEFSGRRDWKLGWWYDEVAFAKVAVARAKQSYGISTLHNFLSVKQNQVLPHDWCLMFKLPGGTNLRWMYADFVIKVDPSDKAAFEKEYPFHAVQVHPDSRYYHPPFDLDRAFRVAFKKAIKAYGEEGIYNAATLRPTKALLNSIVSNTHLANNGLRSARS